MWKSFTGFSFLIFCSLFEISVYSNFAPAFKINIIA
jgi:hypothetical protein